jgi:hypothetical protein
MARFAVLAADADIAASILTAPGWARVGISMPDPGMRERAAAELARAIVRHDEADHDARDQLALPIDLPGSAPR